jgi:hypothetical protein
MSDATERLARSRAAWVEAMRPRHGMAQANTQADTQAGAQASRPVRWFERIRRRWQAHPLHLVAEVAGPVIGAWAARRPLTFLAVAALAGSALVATRPWRRLSRMGALLLALRAVGMPSLVVAGLRRFAFSPTLPRRSS